MLVLEDLHLHDDVGLPPHAMEGVKDGEPAIQRVLRPTVRERVEIDVYLAYGVVGSVGVIVHQSVCARVRKGRGRGGREERKRERE